MVQRCEISIAEHGVSWADGHPACGRRVTHKIASGTLMCSYHAKQKRWSRYHPEPLNASAMAPATLDADSGMDVMAGCPSAPCSRAKMDAENNSDDVRK
jgi:hypothetical protein